MHSSGFTIRIFVPDGDPEGLRIIDRLNWTGRGVVFPRNRWAIARQRAEMAGPGIYILSGYAANVDDTDIPTVYIGQGEVVQERIDSHIAGSSAKDFWDRCIVFTSANNGLHRGHITWLEYSLIKRAQQQQRCTLDNKNHPQEPALPEADKADTAAFLREILPILPLVGLYAFEEPRAVAEPHQLPAVVLSQSQELDTVVVAAHASGFHRVFLGQNEWYSIRISGGMLPKIKYIAAYQTQPISTITHFAAIDRIEPYGDGKYRLIFTAPARPIEPIRLKDAPFYTLQGPRYTTIAKLLAAKQISDLF